jgi:hypothetical protein
MATSFGNSTVQHARQELTSEDKKFAAVNLNETDETRENTVAEIKRWIEESDDLPARIGKNDSGHIVDALKYGYSMEFKYSSLIK